MTRMSVFKTALGLFKAPASPDAPSFTPERWQRPVGFSITIPPEIVTQGATDLGAPVPKVPRALAIQVPAVKRARDLICSTLGALTPRVLDAKNRVVPWDLADQPEADYARSITWTRIVDDLLFEQRSWLRITDYNSGFPSKVVRLEPTSVSVQKQGRVYVNSVTGAAQGSVWQYVPDSELIRIESPNDGLLTAGARAIRIALRLMETAGRYADDGTMLGIIRPRDGADGPGDDKAAEDMLDTLQDKIRRRAFAYMEDMELQPISFSPEQLQLKDARDYAVLEISRIAGIDPEELGVSTTTRTYANAEQRRLDLIDFTLVAYIRAIEERLRMSDVLPPGYTWEIDSTGFLRSDTKTRFETYQLGLQIGTYTPERIAEIERVPVDSVRKAFDKANQPPAPASTPAQESAPKEGTDVTANARPRLTLAFSDDSDGVSFRFEGPTLEFKADKETRTVAGLAVPWNTVAYSGGRKWMFAPNSLMWSDMSRVKLDRDHVDGSEFGVAKQLDNATEGLRAKFGVAPGADGDNMLGLAGAGVYDGFSIFVTLEDADFGPHPDDESVLLVRSGARLRKVALTAIPAFDNARLTSVAATAERKVPGMGDTKVDAVKAASDTSPVVTVDAATFGATVAEAVKATLPEVMKEVFAALPLPQQRGEVKAGAGLTEVREAPVYTMNGHGFSLVRDMWKSRTEGDHDATERLRKFSRQTADIHDHMAQNMVVDPATGRASFAVNTGNANQIIPPGYRPDLFVTQLLQERPLTNSVSRGTLTDATPFNIPKFVSSSGASATHVEGVNPSQGSLTLGITTVTPTAISGLYQLTREIVDSANPAIDAIATQAMRESYSQQTEALVYAELNGANGVGGTITSGFSPSGAQVSTTTGQGDELLLGVRTATALYPFRRFGRINRAHISQEATTEFATAVDTTGRPMLPYVGAMNAVGTSNPNVEGYNIDGLPYQPTWSMTGNTSGDADVIAFNSADVWAWESGLLMFRFEERSGPANIDLALFGYFATRVLRPVGLVGIRHTHT